MKSRVSMLFVGVLALMCVSRAFAATVTVTPSTASPTIGTQFTLTVSGADFPDTVGATLQLTFDPTKVAVFEPALNSGIVLAPGSPFTGGIALPFSCTPTYTSGSACNFSVLAPTVGTLPTGNFDAFQIIFTALAAGNANIVLVDDQADFSWTDAGTFTAVPVTYTQANVTVAAAPPEPNISVTDSVVPVNDLAVAFGNVTVATTNTQTVTVTNAGAGNLSIGLIASANPLAAPFSIITDLCSSQTLAPLSSCTVSVRFSPAVLGAAADAFTIPSNDPDSPAVTVTVNGTGTPPVPNIVVTDSVVPVNDLVVAFGNVTAATAITQTVTVTNAGAGNLSIGLIASANPLVAPFSITNDLCSSQTLTPNSSCTFRVQFQPLAGGPSNDGLDIPSNDPDTPTVTVSVSGTSVPNARDDGPIGVIEGITKVIPVGANDVGFINPVALALTALPTKGTISAFSPPGPAAGMTITYTANIGAVGIDSFAYEMTDSIQARDSATVTLDIGPVPDTVPNPFVFIDQTEVPLNSVITSNTITVTGINVPTSISVVGGEYSINGGTFTPLAGTVSNGNTVTVLRISAGTPLTATSATVTIGGVADTFTATTGPDTDGDSVVDGIDNCTLVPNALAGDVPGTSIPRYQLDSDGDGYGNACDADLNNSGLVTVADFAILRSVLNELASYSPQSAAADLNGSGTVTATDFAILRASLNTPPGPPEAPGPSGLHP